MKTALYDQHVALGAKIVNFAGWEMPIQYKGIIPEHHAVRKAAGLFDVSHMGRIKVKGTEAERFLDFLSTNLIAGKPEGSATYTAWCHENGGTVDDVIVYKKNTQDYFIIVNAGNREKDLNHLKKHAVNFKVAITHEFDEGGILALQGPNAIPIIAQLFPETVQLKPMHFMTDTFEDREIILATTGYTGAGGLEIYANNPTIVRLWTILLEIGKPYGLEPIGLGARDTLRLEMGYALYGHELSDTISPNESVSRWTIKSNKHHFLGEDALAKSTRNQYGLVLQDPGIAREGYQVFRDNKPIGVITSGTFSPTLQKAIAILMSDIPLNIGDLVAIQIRQKQCFAKVVELPFLDTHPRSHQ